VESRLIKKEEAHPVSAGQNQDGQTPTKQRALASTERITQAERTAQFISGLLMLRHWTWTKFFPTMNKQL
jgi:hypothetical protein